MTHSWRCPIVLLMAFFAGFPLGTHADPVAPPPLELREIRLEPFGTIPPIPAPPAKASLTEAPIDLDRAVNAKPMMKALGLRLTRTQKEFLEEHRFLIVPKMAARGLLKDRPDEKDDEGRTIPAWTHHSDEMLGMFDDIGGDYSPENRLPQHAVFINPTVVLHGFHKFFSTSAEHLERNALSVMLLRFLEDMQSRALAAKEGSTGELSVRFERIAAQFTVPLILMKNAAPGARESVSNPEDPMKRAYAADDGDTPEAARTLFEPFAKRFAKESAEAVKAELDLIYEASKAVPSPLFARYSPEPPISCDYTQFTPRGHYARMSALRAYFRTMMYLGRQTWLLGSEAGLSDAILVSYLMSGTDGNGKPVAAESWKAIMEITGFLAGPSDDIGYPEWRNFLVSVLGKKVLRPEDALDPTVLASVRKRLPELRRPRILSDILVGETVPDLGKEDLLEKTLGLRIFGQRFTFDGLIFDRLTAGQEKTPIRLPSLPTALFVPAAFGARQALDLLETWLREQTPPFSEEDAKRFLARLAEVGAELAKISDPEWFGSVRSAWLAVLRPLTATFGDGYPRYMTGPLFPLLKLEEFLAAYTELRHDFILYDKPNYAEMGEGGEGEIPPVPKGFVEPNLPFWHALGRLIEFTWTGFQKYKDQEGVDRIIDRLDQFREQVTLLTEIAGRELAGKPVGDDDYEKLRTVRFGYLAASYESRALTEEDIQSALTVDLFTDLESGKILYQGVGEPRYILILVGNEQSPRLALGVAFGHYEFTEPFGKRLTDAEWKRRVYQDRKALPPKNVWYAPLDIF